MLRCIFLGKQLIVFLEESKLYATAAVLVLLSSDPLQDELEFHFTLRAWSYGSNWSN